MTREEDKDTTLELDAIYKEFRPAIRGYLQRLTKNPFVADDLTQEVFIRVHRNLSSFRGDSSLKTWIYRVASSVFHDHLRKIQSKKGKVSSGTESTPSWEFEDETGQLPDESSIQSSQGSCVRQYIEALSPSYRAVLVMHDMQGLTNPEIAEILGCSLATAKIRLHRAREKLKAAMDQGCELSVDRRGALVCDPKEKES